MLRRGRAASWRSRRSSACRATPARPTTPPRRPASSASCGPSPARPGRAGCASTRSRPGFIRTRLTDVLADEHREHLLSATALGRLGDPEDVAGPGGVPVLAGRGVHHRCGARRGRGAADMSDARRGSSSRASAWSRPLGIGWRTAWDAALAGTLGGAGRSRASTPRRTPAASPARSRASTPEDFIDRRAAAAHGPREPVRRRRGADGARGRRPRDRGRRRRGPGP